MTITGVSARAPFEKHILTVQAIDSDAIGTGVVRYLLTDGHTVGNTTLFGIHEKYGILTNRVLMRKYTDSTFFVTVNARDREDVNTAESANTVAKVTKCCGLRDKDFPLWSQFLHFLMQLNKVNCCNNDCIVSRPRVKFVRSITKYKFIQ